MRWGSRSLVGGFRVLFAGIDVMMEDEFVDLKRTPDMTRRFFVAAVLIAAGWTGIAAAMQNDLLPETTAARHGLTRPWFAQVELDQARGSLVSAVLYEGVLYCQTNTANLHAIDAETGKTLWSKQIGLPNHPSMPPDARGDMLAVVNGSRLFVVNRFNGDLLYEKEIKDAPGSGPALSSKRAYVPSVTGLIVAYQMELADNTKKAPEAAKSDLMAAAKTAAEAARRDSVHVVPKYTAPLCCQSFGRALVQPLVTRDDLGAEYVIWPTDRGYLNFGRINRTGDGTLAIKYRLATGATIVAKPAYLPPDPKTLGDAGVVYAASCDGFLYAVQEETGETLWRFSTGDPILESPAVIDGRVYITTQLGGMYAVDAKTGKSLWWTENVARFVAASKTRVYGTDSTGQLLVLNAATGARIDAIPTEGVSTILANPDTDRIYMISKSGLIQCLRETEQIEPLAHNKERKDAAKAGLIPPEPKKEVEEKPKKEHVAAPRAPTPPREKKATPKKEPKQPKQPRGSRKGGRNAGGGLGPGGNPADPFGQPPAKGGRIPKLPKNGNNNNGGGDNPTF
jgi:outer membrane protein assembly factor BamB